jgi:hypothetical protein
VTKSVVVNVENSDYATSLTATPTTATYDLGVGQPPIQITLTTTPTNVKNRTFAFTTSGTGTAIVAPISSGSNIYQVTPTAAGDLTITFSIAIANGGTITAPPVTITIRPAPTGVTIKNKDDANTVRTSFTIGETHQYAYAVDPPGSNQTLPNMTWTSSDIGVMTITQTDTGALVTAKAEGETVIMVSNGETLSAKITVTVVPGSVGTQPTGGGA